MQLLHKCRSILLGRIADNPASHPGDRSSSSITATALPSVKLLSRTNRSSCHRGRVIGTCGFAARHARPRMLRRFFVTAKHIQILGSQTLPTSITRLYFMP